MGNFLPTRILNCAVVDQLLFRQRSRSKEVSGPMNFLLMQSAMRVGLHANRAIENSRSVK